MSQAKSGAGDRPKPRQKPRPPTLSAVDRAEIMKGFAELALPALLALKTSLGAGKQERNAGARSTNARYVLDVLLDRLPVEVVAADAEARDTSPIDELATRRQALLDAVRAARTP